MNIRLLKKYRKKFPLTYDRYNEMYYSGRICTPVFCPPPGSEITMEQWRNIRLSDAIASRRLVIIIEIRRDYEKIYRKRMKVM